MRNKFYDQCRHEERNFTTDKLMEGKKAGEEKTQLIAKAQVLQANIEQILVRILIMDHVLLHDPFFISDDNKGAIRRLLTGIKIT